MENQINRRRFLQNTLLTTTGFALGGQILTTFASAGDRKYPTHPFSGKNKRSIGTLEVTPIGLGCMNMAGIYNALQPKPEMVKVIRLAIENGVDFLDTAEVYGPFYREEIVGEAIKPFRSKVNVATKFGFDFEGDRITGRNSKPKHIRSAVEGSLKRLQIETIDLLYLHRMDPGIPIEDIAGTVKELIQQGKVRNFGLSEVSPETIRKAHAVQPVAALQSEYSMLEWVMEKDIFPLCEELDIAFVPWARFAEECLQEGLMKITYPKENIEDLVSHILPLKP